MRKLLRRLRKDESGMAMVYVSAMLPVLVGMGALAVDAARYVSWHSELQAAADAAALAAAKELDGMPGAQARARAAMTGAVQNSANLGEGTVTVSTANCAGVSADEPCIRFLKSLPAQDTDPITAEFEAASDYEARFVQVRLGTKSMPTFFAAALDSGASAAASISSVAGNEDMLVCNTTGVFICNPTEPASNLDPALQTDMSRLAGRELLSYPADGRYGKGFKPGNFSMSCPAGADCRSSTVNHYLASRNGSCMPRYSSTTTPPPDDFMVGVNVRLDWYSYLRRTDKSWDTILDYAPSLNVTQDGAVYRVKTCDWSNANGTTPSIAGDATHPGLDGQLGDGSWNWRDYLEKYHPTITSLGQNWPFGDVPYTHGMAGPTRFQVYRYEIEFYSIPEAPQCATRKLTNDPNYREYSWATDDSLDGRLTQDRRVMSVGIVNCNAAAQNGGLEHVTPSEYIYGYLIGAMKAPTDALRLEIVGATNRQGLDDKLLQSQAQIYRR